MAKLKSLFLRLVRWMGLAKKKTFYSPSTTLKPKQPTAVGTTNGTTIKKADIPNIIDLDINVKTHGKYLTKSKKAKGLVVHYTAGRFEKGRQAAVNSLSGLAKRGLGCLIMDINGQIYKAKSQGLDEVAWHAGKSSYSGLTSMSKYLYGIEICNAGLLDDKGRSWYGLQIPEKEQRKIDKQLDNQKAGTYHKFSEAQEKSLENFVLWQLDVNPEFDIDFVIGHDECAPARKSDPGGSLSVTMPNFRDMIKQRI